MPNAFSNQFEIRRWKSYPYCGRLIVLDNNLPLKDPFDVSQLFSIDFPAMPDQIELARKAEYRVVANMVMPDGIHQYIRTEPLKIPFSFKIHHADEDYCREGPLTLLNVAARFHALVTPLGSTELGVQVSNDGNLDEDGNAQPGAAKSKGDAVTDQNSGQAASATGANSQSATYQANDLAKTDPPVAVRLELIMSRLDGPGIICTGYVEDVKATLCGPWLRGPDKASNLPTSAEYSFTFVHRPGHGNWFSNKKGIVVTTQAQAYAQWIKARLYNTRDLPNSNSGMWRGFGQVPDI